MAAKIRPSDNNGSIRIRFTYLKQSYQITNLGRFDDPVALRKANLICEQISLDIASGCFDFTLTRYKPQSSQPSPSQKTINWLDKLNEYHESRVKTGDCTKGYLKDLVTLINKLEALDRGITTSHQALFNWLSETQTPYTLDKSLSYLVLCANWLIARDEIAVNPFVKLKPLISKRDDETYINPFTPTERAIIIAAFKENKYYRHYKN